MVSIAACALFVSLPFYRLLSSSVCLPYRILLHLTVLCCCWCFSLLGHPTAMQVVTVEVGDSPNMWTGRSVVGQPA